MSKVKKLKPGSRGWLNQLKLMVLAECPELILCRGCNRSIRQGYCCMFCGDTNPGNRVVNPADWL